MGNDRHFSGWSPAVPHLARGGEIADLRSDIEGALRSIASELASDIPTLSVSCGAVAGNKCAVTLQILDSVGGDPVEAKTVCSVGAFLPAVVDTDLPGVVASASFGNVTKGTLLDGDGLAAMNLETADDGECVLELTYVGTAKIVVAGREWYGGPSLNCVVRDVVQF